MFSKFSDHYPTAKELLSELVKMVMVVPFSDKVVAAQPEDTAEPDVMVIEEEAAVDNKPKDTEVIHSCQKQCCGAGPMLTGSGSCGGLQITQQQHPVPAQLYLYPEPVHFYRLRLHNTGQKLGTVRFGSFYNTVPVLFCCRKERKQMGMQ